tara:strand:- start:1227 stop:1592 length:366 start_codon:yes stop_codon:yes gene_type:complete
VKTPKWLLISALLTFSAPAGAQTTAGLFSQGSMNSTTTTEQTITETIAIERYGAKVDTWSGHNVVPSAEINNTSTTYSIHTTGDDFQLEITSRAAGIIETEDISRTIETTSTTTSLSVFSK